MGDKTRSCIFCGRSAPEVKMTREHVIRDWLGQQLRAESPGRSPNTTIKSVSYPDEARAGPSQERPVHLWDYTLNDVCGSCNHGWLNREVEMPVQRQLLAMIRGAPAIVTSREIAVKVATWATKTAYVFGVMQENWRVLTPDQIGHLRQTLTPPPLVAVRLAHISYYEWLSIVSWSFGKLGGPREYGYVSNLMIGEMMLQVIIAGGAMSFGAITSVLPPHSIASSLAQLWPAPPVSVSFPPGPQLRRPMPEVAADWPLSGLQAVFPPPSDGDG
jgi:hypothetical protein